MIVADTDVLIDFLRGREPGAEAVGSALETGQLQTTAVSCFELLSGARTGREREIVERLLDRIPVLALDRDAARRAAEVRRDLDQVGEAIGMADSLIAGIALAHNSRLLTRNRRHFERVASLSCIDFEQSTN